MFRYMWFVIATAICGLAWIGDGKSTAQDGSDLAERPLWTSISDTNETSAMKRDEASPCDCAWSDACGPRWTFSADALILDRVMNPTRSIGSLGLNFVTGQSFDFTAATGPRVSAVYQWDEELATEINYFGIHGWHAERYRTTEGGMSVHGLFNFGSIFMTGGWEYGSRIDSAEFNLRWSPADRITWIAGFRYVEWAEILRLRIDPPQDAFRYDALTNNQLYGGQIGLDCLWWDRGGALQCSTIVKAGGYSNTAFVHSGVLEPDKGNKTAFLGEVATIGRYALSDTWALRGGYQLMWLSGIAVAPDQLTVPLFSEPDLSGGVFLHGAIVGIEANW